MVKRFVSQYGFETTEKMLKENNEPPVQTLRVNLFKRTVEQVHSFIDARRLYCCAK